jgi:hypothetical protein
MQFYRGQQAGSAPQRLFLSGGASIMPYTAQFFAEKLNLPVEYFNPLRNVQFDPEINLEDLARVAHSLGEVVGLGLRNLAQRNLAHCPVELNLMPDSTLRWQSFNRKKPYLLTTVFLLAGVVGMVGWLFQKSAANKADALQDLNDKIQPIQEKSDRFHKAYQRLQDVQQQAAQITSWNQDRYYWGDIFSDLRHCLMQAEDSSKQKLGADTGIWIENLSLAGANSANATPDSGQPPPPPANGDQGDTITLLCRAVSMTSVSASANTDIAFAMLTALKADPLFVPDQTQFNGNISGDDPSGTFTFAVNVKLKQPLKL